MEDWLFLAGVIGSIVSLVFVCYPTPRKQYMRADKWLKVTVPNDRIQIGPPHPHME